MNTILFNLIKVFIMANETNKPPYVWKDYARNIPFMQILEEWKSATDEIYKAYTAYYSNPPEEVSEAEGEKLLRAMVTCATAFEHVRNRLNLSNREWVYKECLNGEPRTKACKDALRGCVKGFRIVKYLEKYVMENP